VFKIELPVTAIKVPLIVINQDCQLARFQALKVKVLPEKDQVEADIQVNQFGIISVITIFVHVSGQLFQ
jgi:hypothetical protein